LLDQGTLGALVQVAVLGISAPGGLAMVLLMVCLAGTFTPTFTLGLGALPPSAPRSPSP
jgi:hypothetical protein